MKSFSIESRLYVISAVAAIALAAIASLTWFRAQYVHQIQEDVNHITEVEILLLRLDRIGSYVVASRTPAQLDEFEAIYTSLNNLVGHFDSEADIVGVSATFLDELAGNIKRYRALFMAVVDNLERIGRDRTEGQLGGMQESLNAAEEALAKISDLDARNAIRQRLMMVQHQEKDLMQLHLDVDMEEFDSRYNRLLGDVRALIVDNSIKQAFIASISAYRDHFKQLAGIVSAIGLTNEEGMRAQLNEVAQKAHDNVKETQKLIAATALQQERRIDTTNMPIELEDWIYVGW